MLRGCCQCECYWNGDGQQLEVGCLFVYQGNVYLLYGLGVDVDVVGEIVDFWDVLQVGLGVQINCDCQWWDDECEVEFGLVYVDECVVYGQV